jgi:cytochrome c55X
MNKLTLLISFAVLSTQVSVSSSFAQANELQPTKLQKAATLTEQRKAQLVHMVKQDCGSCHGMTLKGGLGPALLPENVKDKPLLFIQNTILYGRPGTAMPPWTSILTKQEVLWISQGLQQGTYLKVKSLEKNNEQNNEQKSQGNNHDE